MFRKIKCDFQDNLNTGIKDIKPSKKMLTPTDEISDFYKINKEKY